MGKSATLANLRGTPTPALTPQALTRRTSLSLPQDFSLTEWQRFGKHLFLISDSSCWWLGDWLVYGQEKYPNRYRQATDETGLDYKTLRNYAWVARRFAVSERNPKVSFQHHAEVASFEPAERTMWLERAAREGWSRNMLRQQARQALSAPEDEHKPQVRLQVHVTSEQETRWATAAERHGRNLAEWIVACLDRAAGQADTHDH
ncbi:LmbU family transcriptional regulator [Streptomyces sp. NBC_01518]|uniref:LmbU family transcriptional regulator n=1 Tax=Streptomyces sp. NBC_01518 TaxID=2903891 RepID=UPI0038679BF4